MTQNKKRIFSVCILLPLILCLFGCETQEEESGKTQVYASFYAMSALAEEIAGGRADVHTLVPSGGEPHDYEPTARDVKNILKADVFIYSGGGMENWPEDFTETISSGSAAIIEASEGIPTELDGGDPHIWLDSDNALYIMGKIKDALVSADESNAEYYEENYKTCQAKAAELKQICEGFKGNGRKVVVTHPAYGYLMNSLSLKQVAIEKNGDNSDPSPSRIAEIAKLIKQDGIKCVFYEKYGSDKIAASAAEAAGGQAVAVPLNSLETGEGSESYFEVMRSNIAAICEAAK